LLAVPAAAANVSTLAEEINFMTCHISTPNLVNMVVTWRALTLRTKRSRSRGY